MNFYLLHQFARIAPRRAVLWFWKPVWLVMLLIVASFNVMAQQTVKGKVTDSNGSPIPGVSVLLEGTGQGTVTDTDGAYSLDAPADGVLIFSFIGYVSERRPVGSQSDISIVMTEDILSLQEVVVIGYGEVKKSNVTGAIVSVKDDDLKRVPVTNVMESLQGAVPGMDITRSSGAAGGGISVRVRGNRSLSAVNEPLYIVDGVQYESIQDLNPNDIQSMEVLKDAASTAIYGSRGANGVILVTTKKGASGKTKVFFNAYGGPSRVNGYPEVMNGAEYANQRREAKRAVGQWSGPADDATIFSAAELENIQNNTYTDWQDLVLQDGSQQDYQLGISSGTDKTNLYISFNYFNENGLFKGDQLDRYSFRVNLDHSLSKIVKVGTQTQFTYYDQDIRFDPMNTVNKLSPLEDAYDEDGNIIELVNNGKTVNPLLDTQNGNYQNNQSTSRVFSSAYLEIKPVSSLSFRSIVGVTNTNTRQGIFAGQLSMQQNNTQARTQYANVTTLSINLENILTFRKSFNNQHNLTVTGIQSLLRNKGETHQSSGLNQLLSSQGFYGLGNANAGVSTYAQYVENALLSFTGRVQYDFNEKYLFTLVGRYDGASQLSGDKWALFPSVQGAWRVIEEGFMADQRLFTDLKLRASYGTAGNSSVDPYDTQSVLNRVTFAYDEKLAVGYALSPLLGNDNLNWEISNTVNVGLDFALLGNKLSGTIDVFQTKTHDLLLERLLPTSSGFERSYQNVGKTETKGIELGLNGTILERSDFKWKASLSWFTTKEEIVALATGSNDIANGWFIGEPTQAYYDYERLGIWQTDEADQATLYGQIPGEIKVKDQDGSTSISTTNDRVVLGSPRPKWIGNLNNDFQYKSFDLSVQVFARWGQMIQSTFANIYDPTANENSIKHTYWTPENPSNEYPRPNANTSRSAVKYLSTMLYEDGSYIKIRGITLGYNFPKGLLEKTPLSQARIYASAKNFWVNSKLDYDPERGGAESTPLSKLFVMGVNLQF